MVDKIRKNLIISVDDFGISPEANKNILELVRRKKVDRVSVMVSPNLKQAEIQELLASGVKLDIHCHLIEENSDYWRGKRNLSEPVIKRLIYFLFKYILGGRRPRVVKERWEKQFKKFYELFGRYPDGINSHEHLHFFPTYLRVAIDIAKDNSIPYLRLGRKRSGSLKLAAIIMDSLRMMDKLWKKNFVFDTSDDLVSFDWTTDWESYSSRFSENKSIELVFHPERESEMAFLLDKNLK